MSDDVSSEGESSAALIVTETGIEPSVSGMSRLGHDLRMLFNMFDRLVTMLRVYPRGHPLLDEIAAQIESRFNTTFEDYSDAFEVIVDATALMTEDETEFFSRELSDKEQYIWYNPYSDGMLGLTFSQGITGREILDFLGVIDRSAQGIIPANDDSVTLMWELDLPHIDYYAVEGFADGGAVETFEGMTEPDAIRLVADGIEEPGGDAAKRLFAMFENVDLRHVDIFTRIQLRAEKELNVPEIREDDLTYAFIVDQELIDQLGHEWREGVDLEYRLIEALLSIIRGAPRSDAADRASEMIITITRQLLDRQKFTQATRILELLHDRRELFTDPEVDPLGRLIDDLSDPLQLEALIHTLQKNPEQRGPIVKLLLLLGPDLVQRQVLNLIADDSRNVVAMSQLMDVVIEATTPHNEHQILHKELLAKPTYLRRLLRELSGRAPGEFSPTPRLLRAALLSDDLEVTEAGLKIDHPVWSDQVIAEKYLIPMARRHEEEIRKYAMERLSEYHPKTFRNVIRETIEARDSQGRTFAEVRFLMRMYLESNEEEAVADLRSMLDVKGWLSKSKRDFAKMAAAVLIERGDDVALEKVRQAADSRWTASDLKLSYSTTLKRYARTDVTVKEEPVQTLTEAIDVE